MSDKTGIEWTDATWNPIVGCSVVSPGCTNCYAMKQAARIIAMAGDRNIGVHYDLTVKDVKGKPVWTGHVAQAPDATLTQPLRWKRGRRIFVNSMGDLFHENVPDAWIDRVFAVMALCRQHTFQILTKRSKRMLKYMSDPETSGRVLSVIFEFISSSVAVQTATRGYIWPFRNVWLGVSAERQQEAYERIPDLLATAAAVRFVSAEPLVGQIDFTEVEYALGRAVVRIPKNVTPMRRFPRDTKIGDMVKALGGEILYEKGIDWIICGGESGPGARPAPAAWYRSIRDQCAACGVPYFHKQNGEWIDADEWLRIKATARTFQLRYGDKPLNFRQAEALAGEDGYRFEHQSDGSTLIRVGKARAGRLLDGRTHDDFPQVRA